jgi:hypothetical protein
VTPAARDGGAEPALRPYEAIREHAELELELAGRGEVDRLAALAERWEALIAGLPPRAPASAAALLEQARLIHERTRIELARLREALLSELALAGRARRAANGYTGELQRRPRLDRSA